MAEQLSSAKGETRVQDPTRAERTAGRRSAESRATVPDLVLTAEVRMDRALQAASSPDAALLRASALALRECGRANASYRDGRFELHSRVNVAFTVQVDGAYLLPTIFDADRKGIEELAEEIAALGARAAAGELSAPELAGATFTLYTLYGAHADSSSPIVVPPQAAAASAGAIREVPIVDGGVVATGRVMTLSLACDHRILFGAEATGFLGRIKSLLEDGAL